MGRDFGEDREPPDRRLVSVPAAVARQELAAANPLPVLHHGAHGQAEQDGNFDLIRYWRILVKRRILIFATTGVFLLLAFVSTFLMTPVYRATTTLQIDRDTVTIVNVEGFVPDNTGGQDFFQTQHELLKSHSLADRVVSHLGLADDKRFMNSGAPSGFAWLFGGPSAKADDEEAAEQSAEPQQEDPGDNSETAARRRAAIGKLRAGLGIQPIRGSRLVRVTFDHPDPAVAQRVANGFGENFIADNLDRRYEASSYARKFLEERLQQLRARLEETETQLVAYAREQQIINLDDSKQTLTGAHLAAVNSDISRVRAERIKLEELWRQARDTDGYGLPQILSSSTIQNNRQRRSALSAEYQQKLSLYKPAFPAMVQLQAQINELDAQAASEIETIKESLKRQFEAAQSEENALVQQLNSLKGDTLALRDRSIQYNILQREVDTNRQLYDGLLQRYKEIGVAGGVGTNNISIVDQAQKPGSPASPRLSLNLAFALFGGLICGAFGALGLEYLDDTFKSPEDVEAGLGVPVLGVIPKPKADLSIDDALKDPWSAMSEAYRSLRTAVQFSTADGAPKSIVVTSARPSEGKSTTALTLAKNFAQLGRRVLLIDADLRNPSLHKRLGLSNGAGLSNYLTGSMLPQDAVHPTPHDNLVFMSSGPLPPNPAELLSGPKMMSLLTLGSEKFDLIVVDAPPVMGLADAPLLASVTAGTLLVIAAGETRQDAARIAVKRLHFARAQVLGALLSKFDSSQVSYGYGYGYGYGEDYHSYGTKQITDAKASPAGAGNASA